MPTVPLIVDLAALQGCWRSRSSFTLLDLNFADGQRLLTVVAALLRDADAPACLHYVAVIDAWPDALTVRDTAVLGSEKTGEPATPFAVLFATFLTQLKNAWLPAVPGYQRLILADGRLVLTLISGALEASLPQLDLAFDACYCRVTDATPAIVQWLGRLATPGSQLRFDPDHAEASIVADVRKNIAHAGFAEREISGDALHDDWSFQYAPHASHTSRHASFPSAVSFNPSQEKHAIVIGAGLAGAAACYRLTARGWRCTLIEQHAAPAQQASGNAAGIFMPVLSQDDNPLSRLTRAAYLFALHSWDSLGGIGQVLPGQACGVLQVARSDAAPGMAATRRTPWYCPSDFAHWMESAEASAALQQRVAGGWWFPSAGWLQPSAVCEAMLKACGDRLHILYQRQTVRLMYAADQWHALDADGLSIAHAPVMILANGVQAGQFTQTKHLPLTAIRGQVTHLPAQAADVPFVVCGDAYLTPAVRGVASLGATYDQDADTSLRLTSHAENMQHLQQMLPDWRGSVDLAALEGRVGFRCVAADRLPLVGALPDPDQLAGSGDIRLQDMPRLPGLHGLLAYGSRGLIWSSLAAELLAAQLNGEPSPLPRDLIALLDPARFALKQRRRAV